MPNSAAIVIKTPQGIRFDCSGCGNCCLNWPVPLTDLDVQNINQYRIAGRGTSVRRLPRGNEKMQTFTHSMEKRSDGRCIFLTEQNRCELHATYGETAKPSMCRLFPYTFSMTPDGVRASVSFASTGVLFNSGKLLSEQIQMLQERYEIFQQLFPHLEMNWNNVQLLDGIALDPALLSELQREFEEITDLARACDKARDRASEAPSNFFAKLQKMSSRAAEQLPSKAYCERVPRLESSPETIDKIILKYLDKLYFPRDVFQEDKFDLDIQALMQELVSAPQVVTLNHAGHELAFNDVASVQLSVLPADLQDLIDRFLYCRVFSWLYFGPGFHHLSLISGLHHLMHLEVLLRLKLKCILLSNGASTLSIFDLAELVRTMERRLTQLQLSDKSIAGLEVLLPSLERAGRLEYFRL